MVKLWGSMLQGVSQGFDDYQKGQEDLAYTRQTRMNQLAGQQLANQQQQLANQQQQQQLQDAQYVSQLAKTSLNQSDGGDVPYNPTATPQPGQAPQGQNPAPQAPQGQNGQGSRQAPAGGTDTGTGVQPGTTTTGLKQPRGAYTWDQYAQWDKQYGFPPGTSYALIQSESGGNPNAVSKKGAVGPAQVMPATAAQPGYGLPNGMDPKDPNTGFRYLQALNKKMGGDWTKTYAAFNAGAGGDPSNPESQGYLRTTAKYQQEYGAHATADQAARTPSPAQQVGTAERAGVPVSLPQMSAATNAQGQRIAQLDRMSVQAAKEGHFSVSQNLASQADKLRGEQLDLQTKQNTLQKSTNEQVANLAANVHDQDSYNYLQGQIRDNPAMQSALTGLNLTGSYDLDRNKLETLASRTQSLKDIQESKIKTDDQRIKDAKEQREADADNRQRLQEQQIKDGQEQRKQQAVQADQNRRTQAAQSGLPYVPSLEAGSPAGATPKEIADARKTIDTKWQNFDKGHETQRTGAQNVMNLAGQIHTMVSQNPGLVGGWTTALRDHAGNWALSSDQQILVKSANGMVVQAQAMAAPGAQRSAATAAYAKILMTTKPSITMSPDAAVKVSNDYYMMGAAQVEQDKWLDRARAANPDATPESLLLQWRRYESSLGPAQYYDPKTKSMVPNSASIPTLPDGSANPAYRSPDDYFAHEGQK